MCADAKAILIFIPLPLRSHLVSAVETAKLLVSRDDRLAITILVMKLPTNITSNKNTSPHPRINLVELQESKSESLSVVERHKEEARHVVAEMIKSGSRVAGFLLDMFCTPMIDVANQLCIPSYIFFPCGSSSLGLFLHLQTFKDDHGWDLNEYDGSDKEVSIPTHVNPVPAKLWPAPVFGKGLHLLDIVRRYRETRGIIINTFLEFEPRAINSLSADHKFPPVYPVGPIIQQGRNGEEEEEEEEEEIKGWLDEQPNSSVVFLCFGTNGYFKREQVNEIALALQRSGLRFLWSLRKPPPEGAVEFSGEYKDVEEALPEGVLEGCGEKGKVILGWVPQMGVLSHPAVGGFVSHCGWNSILESVWWGVPMAAWPLDAEQQLNAFLLVKELEMAVEIKMDYVKNSDMIVGADTIKAAMEQLMEPESKIRVKVKELQHKSREAIVEGGSSYNLLGGLVDKIMDTIS